MSKGLATVASIPFMAEAWRRLYSQARKRSRDGFGVDGESINDFTLRERQNLAILSEQVRTGKYEFSLLTPHVVAKPKPRGGHRIICVPTVRDRIVQRALVEFVSQRYMEAGKKTKKLKNAVSYGFVRGRTVEAAIKTACAFREVAPWVYKTDITSFFDTISRVDLRRSIEKHITEVSLHRLLIAASECEVDQTRPSIRTILRKNGIRRGAGVRQGMPLSPIFANLLMVEFDRALTQRNAGAIRYADDLIFFAATSEECFEHHKFCKEKLKGLGLTVPDIGVESKSQIFAPHETADFLGVGIAQRDGAYRPIVTSDQFEAMRGKFMALGDVPALNARHVTLGTYGAVLNATVDGYLGCYQFAHNHLEVERQLENFREMAMAKMLGALHVDIKALDPPARAFIGL